MCQRAKKKKKAQEGLARNQQSEKQKYNKEQRAKTKTKST